MACSNCSKPKMFAGGLCSACYSRLRRRGTLARKNVVNLGLCSEPGCDRKSFSKNLCGLHYQRAQHPLTGSWKSLRSASPNGYPAAWDDFQAFLLTVGEKPTPAHQLRRRRPDLPWSTENFVWREPVADRKRVGAIDYARRWDLRNKYGITPEDFSRMMRKQGGKCATCPASFAEVDPKTGHRIRVCVDHDHRTGKTRGPLCDPCNKALGLYDDDISRLEAAIRYLRFHGGAG